MPAIDYRSLAESIVEKVGGEHNIAGATHCATRLRLNLKDDSKADKAAVEKLPGVITVMEAGGQFQVVIGNNVPLVYAELGRFTKLAGDNATAGDAPKGNIFNRFFDLISSIFSPILWPLAAAGLFKAFLLAATQWNWLEAESQTFIILNAAADALFYFLPLFLAVTSAKRFNTNQFTSMAIAGALVYPAIVALNTGDRVEFAGIPFTMMTYTSSVIPIIVAVWIQGYLERFLNRVLPSVVRNFTTPLLTLAVMVPLVLITVGPLTIWVGESVSQGIESTFGFAPWLAGGLLGGFYQVFVLFGLHWGLLPFMVTDISTQGSSLMYGPLLSAVLAQAGATLAVLLRTRNPQRREVAGPAAFSGFLAGVTEPAIYGVNLPLKRPFIFGSIGGAVGGAIAAAGGSAATSLVLPSLLALPAYTEVGSFTAQLIGTGIAVAIGFTLTFLFVDRETENAASVPAPADGNESLDLVGAVPASTLAGGSGAATAVDARTVDVLAPVTGRVVPLSEVTDKVFSSRALGDGLGVVPDEGRVYAPVSGKVMVAMPAGHAYGIKSPEGVEVLVHVGIDTVNLNGLGFRPAVEKGQEVKAGDLLAEFDLNLIVEAGYDTTTLLVVTNTNQFQAVTPIESGTLEHGARALRVQI